MSVAGILKKLFGSKSDRDMKQVKPVLEKVLKAYEEIDKLSADELRQRSEALKSKLRECEEPFEQRIAAIKEKMKELGDLALVAVEGKKTVQTMDKFAGFVINTAPTKPLLIKDVLE